MESSNSGKWYSLQFIASQSSARVSVSLDLLFDNVLMDGLSPCVLSMIMVKLSVLGEKEEFKEVERKTQNRKRKFQIEN